MSQTFCRCRKAFVFVIAMFLSSLLAQRLLFLKNPIDSNISIIKELDPKDIWNYFAEICMIPRNSGNEKEIANFILEEAFSNKLSATKDSVGNIIVRKPASSKEFNNVPSIAIQCHMDMVCEKNKDSKHDFAKDPIKLVRKGNYIYADGTTLGADNGIGIATSLALMKSKELVHGPLEFIFTVEEETTFNGASNITNESIKSRSMINVDSEDHGQIFVGCAGSCDVLGTMKIKREKLDGSFKCYLISIDGLYGGHSGVDIDKERLSALKIMSSLLQELKEIDYRIASIKGGNKHNAIPRDAEIIICIPDDKGRLFEDKFKKISENLKQKFKMVEPSLIITKKSIDQISEVIDMKSHSNLILILDKMLHGVIKMSDTLHNIVETSTNFASIHTDKEQIKFATMQRSLIGKELKAIAKKVIDIFETCNVVAGLESETAEWQPNENSRMLKFAKDIFEKLFGKKPEIKAVHAGLECGEFVSQIEGLDAISFGPTIIDAHSPNEHIDITTLEPFYYFLTQLLESFAINS